MNRYLPAIVFIVVSSIGAGMTAVVNNAEETATRIRFESIATEASDRVRERVSQHISFLLATHSFVVANRGDVSPKMFETYIAGINIGSQLEGVQGIGMARFLPANNQADAAISDELDRNYGITRNVWPETNEKNRAPIVMLEPKNVRNIAALGFDMFTGERRRAAMLGAIAFDQAHASAPVQLVQEITTEKQMGFLVYIPVHEQIEGPGVGPVNAFVYAPFRAGDLHDAALGAEPKLPIIVETSDTTDEEPTLLFRSKNFEAIAPETKFNVERTIEVAGRTWTMSIHEMPGFRNTTGKLGTFALGIISLLLAAALAASTRSQLKAVEAARELHALSEKTSQEKDMLLQEMKHRIKNSIARVLAMARQTAVHSNSIEEFSNSFSARLQAMSNAQDMLTRSHWQRADLEELLSKELQQVFGSESCPENNSISGPKIELNERATQALGLVFHELATNALKYGGMSEDGGGINISWRINKAKKPKTLNLSWAERSSATVEKPESTGFGTRLIDANIKLELGGTVERTYAENGINIKITIPLAKCV